MFAVLQMFMTSQGRFVIFLRVEDNTATSFVLEEL